MGQILSNILGLGRHGECGTCDVPIAEEGGNQTGRWRAAPIIPPAGQRGQKNQDGSVNLDGTACNDSRTGKHHPRPGSLW